MRIGISSTACSLPKNIQFRHFKVIRHQERRNRGLTNRFKALNHALVQVPVYAIENSLPGKCTC
jgi:hypothetical protein